MKTSVSLLGVALIGSAAMIAGPASASPSWMHVNSAKKQVTFNIREGAKAPAGQYNFDKYSHGQMTITVPKGWHVTMHVKNVGSTGHSLMIIKAPASPPAEPSDPAFKGAETTPSKLASGLPPGSSSSFSFTASRAGQYWMVCGVPGHALMGMWDHFVVSSSAAAPSVKTAS